MSLLQRAKKQGRKFLNPIETSVGGFSMMFKILPLYLSNKEERVPKIQLGPFRTDPAVFQHPPQTDLRITWMGHSSLLVEIDGFRLLIDPVWDQRASPVRWGGPKRFFAPPLKLEDLPRLDAVIVSHDHYDHLGKSTIQRLSRLDCAKDATWITSLGIGEVLTSFGVDRNRISELDWTQSATLASAARDLTITALPARHFSGRGLSNRFETLWSSFAILGDTHRIYYGADSGLWPGFPDIARDYGPFDVTMLEIGASSPLWNDIHMGPEGAAEAFTTMGAAGLLMPVHWGLFDLALHAWRQPIQQLTELATQSGLKLWSPTPGTPTEVVPGEPFLSDWWR